MTIKAKQNIKRNKSIFLNYPNYMCTNYFMIEKNRTKMQINLFNEILLKLFRKIFLLKTNVTYIDLYIC